MTRPLATQVIMTLRWSSRLGQRPLLQVLQQVQPRILLRCDDDCYNVIVIAACYCVYVCVIMFVAVSLEQSCVIINR